MWRGRIEAPAVNVGTTQQPGYAPARRPDHDEQGEWGVTEPHDGPGVLPPVPLEPLRVLDPRQLGRYRLLGRLGTGGMGVAFLTEGDGDWAVVKMIRSDITDDRAYRARITGELEAMRRAAGPLAAALLESDLDGEPAWFAMEFIPGMTLTRRVADLGAGANP